ncbi:hypothetical protein EGW08_018686 [Elysia chlorotica]|uniref:Cation-transporting ATPase n=1 Tax=Elysia chlorotica TaxID=188477 RepID=A0A433SWJ3_ELYCH|nr:hypothetical protein EGW08_018686 [Elysia chlorotica]
MNRHTDSKTKMGSKSSLEDSLSRNLLLKTECIINKNTDEELVCWGYTYSSWRRLLFWVAVILSGGLLLLVLNWKPELECYLQRRRCALHKAHFLLIRTRFGSMSVIPVETITGPIEGVVNYRLLSSDSEHLSSYTTSGQSGATLVPDSHDNSNSSNVLTTDDRAQLTSSWQEEDDVPGGVAGLVDSEAAARFFDFQKTRYVWDHSKGSFRKLE